MNGFLWAFAGFGLLGIASFAAYAWLGAAAGVDGSLSEPFFLVLVGWLSSFASGICLLAGFASKV